MRARISPGRASLTSCCLSPSYVFVHPGPQDHTAGPRAPPLLELTGPGGTGCPGPASRERGRASWADEAAAAPTVRPRAKGVTRSVATAGRQLRQGPPFHITRKHLKGGDKLWPPAHGRPSRGRGRRRAWLGQCAGHLERRQLQEKGPSHPTATAWVPRRGPRGDRAWAWRCTASPPPTVSREEQRTVHVAGPKVPRKRLRSGDFFFRFNLHFNKHF